MNPESCGMSHPQGMETYGGHRRGFPFWLCKKKCNMGSYWKEKGSYMIIQIGLIKWRMTICMYYNIVYCRYLYIYAHSKGLGHEVETTNLKDERFLSYSQTNLVGFVADFLAGVALLFWVIWVNEILAHQTPKSWHVWHFGKSTLLPTTDITWHHHEFHLHP